MSYRSKKKKLFFYIYSAIDDLPRCLADSVQEACDFIGCSRRTFYRILDTDFHYHLLKVLTMYDD